MTTKITRINQIAKEKPNEVFTSIYHLINIELLKECFDELESDKAVGIDKITKDEYRVNLDENLNILVNKLKTKSYRPSPARKVNIPKPNGKLRCLAISNFEDKIVQMSVKKIIEAIFEPKFTNNMFGFRPNMSCHDCIKYLDKCIDKHQTNYILDADIKGYFDNINHELIMKGLEMHIKDKNLLRLIRRFLKAGIMENNEYKTSEYGTPQGSILSPILANIVMYYGIILFIERIKKTSMGYVEIVNYADDIVICFEYKKEALVIYQKLYNRLNQLGLEFAKEKTRLIEFGKYAINNRQKQSLGKPETFDFLGFTHYCSTDRNGRFKVKRKTSKKKFKQKVQEFKVWIKEHKNCKLKNLIIVIRSKLIGHYNYYGISDNFYSLKRYKHEIMKILFKWLNRRSQKKSYEWDGYNMMLEQAYFPNPRITFNLYAK